MVKGIMDGKIKSRITTPRRPVLVSILAHLATRRNLLSVSGDKGESEKAERHVERSTRQTPGNERRNERLRAASAVINHHARRWRQ